MINWLVKVLDIKYEYLAREDFGNKPGAVGKAKSKYSPLGKVFNKGLREDEK